MAKLRALLTTRGVPVTYEKDRGGIDTGLHLFVEGPSGYDASQVRVWFQAKGKRSSTLSQEQFESLDYVDCSVAVEHLRFWAAAPEPVYIVIYVESADIFVAEDIRDVVERQWPAGTFYPALAEPGNSVTLKIDASRVLDPARLESMLHHRSMRIDGPAFRGRPLGHRFDPLRSQIEVCSADLFARLVESILSAHDFRSTGTVPARRDLRLVAGRVYQTLEWQSPAFAEFGVGPHDDFRDEPPLESIHDRILLVVDQRPERTELGSDERAEFESALETLPDEVGIVVVFNAPDLSGTGGLWRSTLRDLGAFDRARPVRMIGLEALTSMVLVATLIYLDFAPELSWRYVNYQF